MAKCPFSEQRTTDSCCGSVCYLHKNRHAKTRHVLIGITAAYTEPCLDTYTVKPANSLLTRKLLTKHCHFFVVDSLLKLTKSDVRFHMVFHILFCVLVTLHQEERFAAACSVTVTSQCHCVLPCLHFCGCHGQFAPSPYFVPLEDTDLLIWTFISTTC